MADPHRPGDDPAELLRRWAAARGPHDLASSRAWKNVARRITAGDVGPDLGKIGKIGEIGQIGSIGSKAAAGVLIAVTVGAALAGGAWQSGHRFGRETPPPRPAPSKPSAALAARDVLRPAADKGSAGACRALDRYTDPAQLDLGTDEARALTLQPWRATFATQPIGAFGDGIGVLLGVDELRGAGVDASIEHLARHGVRHLLFEASWGTLPYDGESFEGSAGRRYAEILQACRRHGVRPTIRLVSHESVPCPSRTARRRLVAPAKAGDRSLLIDDARDLIVGKSGLSGLSRDLAAEILITELRERPDGVQLSLSKALPYDLQAGQVLLFTTLKYAPFAPPGTPDFAETLAGWRRYLDAIGDLAVRALGTAQAADRGYDLELWNSVAFMSGFLFANRYHDPATPDDDRAWQQLALETARHLQAHPERFAGARLINGFATHSRGDACADLPAPFAGVRRATPGPLTRPGFVRAGARGPDPFLLPWLRSQTSFARLDFPEVEATFASPESFARELGPDRPPGCGVWLSGAGVDPRALAPMASADRAQALKTKLVLRQYAFFLGKGARRVSTAAGPSVHSTDDRGAGLLTHSTLRALRAGDGRPTEPAASPLAALGRLHAATAGGASALPGRPRQLDIRGVTDCHDHAQLRGGAGEPSLANRDVLALLPYQAAERRFVLHYYVMTRDTTADLPPEAYTVTIGGLAGADARVRAYDPVGDRDVEVRLDRAGHDEVTVTLEATDTPRVLVIDE